MHTLRMCLSGSEKFNEVIKYTLTFSLFFFLIGKKI